MESDQSIAVIGMSCRFPNANSPDEFWELLLDGKDCIGTVPDSRWRQEDYPYKIASSCNTMNAGFLSVPIDEFDAQFFGISPKEAIFMDPQVRLLLELVWEGLEDAGVDPTKLRGSNGGVFVGSWLNDYKDILLSCPDHQDFFRRYMGSSIGCAAARVAFLLGMTGPAVATESGCSSSMVALHLACKSLQRDECSLALACGVNLLLKPFNKDELPVMLSPDGRCKTFDTKADGFGRAEGVAALVLKKLSTAIKDEDKILALIKGSAITQEGLSKSLGTPTVQVEALAMTLALKDAGIDASQVSYLEMHGTGTSVGDPIEVKAIQEAYSSKYRENPLLIGSVKANIGHTESVSGLAGIVKAILAINHKIIPRQINLVELNPKINLENIPARIPLKNQQWVGESGKHLIAGVSSFGITGTDAHIIVQEYQMLPIDPESDRSKNHLPQILKFSAKTKPALERMLERFRKLISSTTYNLNDIAFTANTGRADFEYRAVVLGKSAEDILEHIEAGNIMQNVNVPASKSDFKVCFLFTGQGSQYPSMGKTLYETSTTFKKHLNYCAVILEKNFKICIKSVLWGENNLNINQTAYSPIAIFCIEYALLKLWENFGIKPNFVLGHSFGEIAAAVAANIVSVEQALVLVTERCRLIELLPEGRMLVVRADKRIVENAMTETGINLDFAAFNSKEQTVVSGNKEDIFEFKNQLETRKVKSVLLNANHAFHSRHMDPILKDYGNIIDCITKKDGEMTCEFISSVKGSLMKIGDIDSSYWQQHTREPVNFMDACITALETCGCQTFLEMGPKPILSSLLLANSKSSKDVSCFASMKQNSDEWENILSSLGKLYLQGATVNWKGIYEGENRTKVSIPHYPFQGKRFWPDIAKQNFDSNFASLNHPLLGTEIVNATRTKIFEGTLNAENDSRLNFLKDHKIGTRIIFPGAAYLDMCIGAVKISQMQQSITLVALENLVINCPLALGNDNIHVQTILEPGPEQGVMNLKICRKSTSYRKQPDQTLEWQTLVEAKVRTDFKTKHESVILEDFLKLGETSSAKPFYDKVATAGLFLGNCFQSISSFLKIRNRNEIVAILKPSCLTLSKDYVAGHPIILDAILQAIMIYSSIPGSYEIERKPKLTVPVQIGRFEWISDQLTDKNLYIHVSKANNDIIAKLLDRYGNVVAVMSAVKFVETTVKSIETVIEQQTSNKTMPGFWKEIWKKEKISGMQFRVDLQKLAKSQIINQTIDTPEEVRKFDEILQNITFTYAFNALCKLGWQQEANEYFCVSELQNQLDIKTEHTKYFAFVLDMLVERGVIRNTNKDSVMQLNQRIGDIQTVSNDDSLLCSKSAMLLSKIGEKLDQIMSGKLSALEILFPNEPEKVGVADFYEDYTKMFGLNQVVSSLAKYKIKSLSGPNVVLRIIEIGAGTGSYTKILLHVLDSLSVEYEYMYTDISSSLVAEAKLQFETYKDKMSFQRLDIEQDPVEQGFVPEYYDICIACEVIHATRSIQESLKHIRMLLRPNGILKLVETTRMDAHYLTYIFGLLPGYWKFEDKELRSNRCYINSEKWAYALKKSGFHVDEIHSCYMGNSSVICSHKASLNIQKWNSKQPTKTWLMLQDTEIAESLCKKLESISRRVISVHPQLEGNMKQTNLNGTETWFVRPHSEADFQFLLESVMKREDITLEGVFFSWSLEDNLQCKNLILQPFFYLTKVLSVKLAGTKTPLKVIVATKGQSWLDENNMSYYQSSTLLGYCRSLMNESRGIFSCRCVDIDSTCNTLDKAQLLLYEMFNTNLAEPQVSYLSFTKHTFKLQPCEEISTSNSKCLRFPQNAEKYQLILPNTKSINDLQFGPLQETGQELLANEVEIRVHCRALNFRDVLSIIKPTSQFDNMNAVGIDFSGEIVNIGRQVTRWKIGDFVFGLNMKENSPPLASNVRMSENMVAEVPPWTTLCEAATLPVVFGTAYKSLIEIANLQSSNKVLIHTASGGVGLMAIYICKSIVPIENIYVTAGTPRKRAYLKHLGLQNIYNSRNTDYSKQILKDTNGQGVDVVLNSLTSKGFKEATLQSCARNAHFVEMSKLSVWTEDQVNKLRPDVNYTLFYITDMADSETQNTMETLAEFLQKGVVKPLPYLKYDAVNIGEALHYFQRAKHIGKLVITMPVQISNNMFVTPLFNNRSTYLITGGLGGIGYEVGKWMITQGAKYVLLTSRTRISTDTKIEMDKINQSSNVCLTALQLDVSNFEQCNGMLAKIKELDFPPLRGIIHSAGILADGLIQNQTWNKMSSVFKAKIDGTLNLHKLTQHINLEHFVLFSSFAAPLGSPGQSNHAAANQFLDAFCHYRLAMGLPATTINWGNWCEVGVARSVDLPGVIPITTKEGLNALECILRENRKHTLVANIDNLELMRTSLFPQLYSYIDESVLESMNSNPKNNPKQSEPDSLYIFSSEHFRNQYNSKVVPDERLKVIKSHVSKVVGKVLNLSRQNDASSTVDEQTSFESLGMDSLMFVETKNALQTMLGNDIGNDISENLLRENNSVDRLSRRIYEIIHKSSTMSSDVS